jgi:hypothetical protein
LSATYNGNTLLLRLILKRSVFQMFFGLNCMI